MKAPGRARPPRKPAKAATPDTALEEVAHRMAAGDAIDWEALATTPDAGVAGLRTLETLSRLARAERAALGADTTPRSTLRQSAASRRAHPAPAPAAPPATWGPLRLLERIGEGSHGEVYRAHDPALSIDVALKLWFPRWSADADVDGFLEEARTLARLRHPNVLAVMGAARHEGRVGMWTELVRGETLEQALAERGPLGAAEAALIGAELCRALAAVHGAGLVHRDVKTRNVMRAEGGRVVLMDFGSVRSGDAAVPRDGRVEGTPLVTAPEIFAGAAASPGSDLYSLGVLLYRVVSGRYPVEAASIEELAARHGRGERTPLRDLCPAAPAEFVTLVERCLDPEPAARFASAGSLEQALLRFVQAVDAPKAGVAAPPPSERRHNLPAPLTRLVGRERELSRCVELLGQGRLLTLGGVAGCGKTRLALRLAQVCLGLDSEEHGPAPSVSGAWFVDLAPLDHAARLEHALARALHVREERGRTLLESVIARIGADAVLIVLDNCEHLIEAAADVAATLLGACPALRIVASSREALGIAGEAVFPVPPLGLPPLGPVTATVAEATEAVQLFVDGATQARPDFRLTDANAAAVAEICRRLDGTPFAIELAAARIKVLAPDEILAKLDDRFRLLTGGGKRGFARHQTLLETLRWSYDLLTPDERALLRRLSAFAEGWTIDAARVIAGDGGDFYAVLERLTRLVDKSLVVVERTARGTTRYRLLESVRAFAHEALAAAGEEADARARHLDYFAGYAEARFPELLAGPDQADALAACDAEHENVLAALSWCDRDADGARQGLRIAGAFLPYWTNRALFTLGLEQVERALARSTAETRTLEHARSAFAAAVLCAYRGDYGASRRHGEASLALFRELGFKQGIVWALNTVANARMMEGDAQGTRPLYEESLALARQIAFKSGVAIAVNNLANLTMEGGDAAGAVPLFRESVEIKRAQGRSVSLGLSLTNLAEVFVRLGDVASAKAPLIEALEIAREHRRQDRGGQAIAVSGLIAELSGADRDAARLLGAAEHLREAIGFVMQPLERKAMASAIERLRARLGAEALERIWDEGRRTSFEAAMDQALEWLQRAVNRDRPATRDDETARSRRTAPLGRP